MPLYEYQCEKCGELFEVMQKFTDEPIAKHAKCGGPVHKLLSAPALQFKGSGWYITDYGKGGSKTASGAKTEGTNGKKDASPAKSDGPAPSATPAPAASDTK